MNQPATEDEGSVGPSSIGSAYAPGNRIAGRYQLIRVLERGGMGVVWVAHHLGLDVHVALKLVLPEAGSEEAARRLVQEAQAAARLDHPAVLRVLDVGRTEANEPFLVMELLDGEPLADVLQRERRLAPVIAVRTILPIAEALSALHAKGIVHRDVKPQNIFLARSDSGRWQPKLIDFGAAKLKLRPTESRISQSGVAVGTPIYMAPEQVEGAEADARSDLFALSIVLYEAITGAPAFNRATFASLVRELIACDPRPLSDHGVDEPELWEILRRGLALRASRWPAVRDLRAALVRWLRNRGATADIGGVALRMGSIPDGEVLLEACAPVHDGGSAAARSPLAVTLEVTVEPPSARAPSLAERRSWRRILAFGLSAALAAGVVAATRLTLARPPAAPPAAPSSAEGEAKAAPAGPPSIATPRGASPEPAPRASAMPTPVRSSRSSRPRGAALPPDLKDPFR